MCGRFAQPSPSRTLAAALHAADDCLTWEGSYSIAPGDTAPIVVREDVDSDSMRVIVEATWNFRPSWVARAGGLQDATFYNARLKNLLDAGMWRAATLTSRCLVPMGGFFDWKADKSSDGSRPVKRARFLSLPSESMLVAGIAAGTSFSVAVHDGECSSGHVHSSMPVLLDEDTADQWLTPTPGLESAREMLLRVQEGTTELYSLLRCHEVRADLLHRKSTVSDHRLIEPITSSATG